MRERNQRHELPLAHCEWLARNVPVTVRSKEIAERGVDVFTKIVFRVRANSAVVDFPWPHVLFKIHAEIGEDLDRSAAAGSRPDHYDVMYFGCPLDLLHFLGDDLFDRAVPFLDQVEGAAERPELHLLVIEAELLQDGGVEVAVVVRVLHRLVADSSVAPWTMPPLMPPPAIQEV